MRAVGLIALLLGAMSFLYPSFPELHRYVPAVEMGRQDAMLLGGLLVAVGALTLAIFRAGRS